MISDPAIPLSMVLYQPDGRHSPLFGDSLRTSLMHLSISQALSVTEPNRHPKGRGGQKRVSGSLVCPGPGVGKSQDWYTAWSFPHTSRPTEAATNCGSLCSSTQVAQSQTQAASDTGLHQSAPQEAPEATPSGQLRAASEQEPMSSASGIFKGRTRPGPDLLGRICSMLSTCTAARHRSGLLLTVTQPEGGPHT